MTEAQLRNLPDEELLRVAENAWVPTGCRPLVSELARRLAQQLDADRTCPHCFKDPDEVPGCMDDDCPYCHGSDD